MGGNEVSWQKWRFRYLMHPREGLVLYLVTYDDPQGKPQPVLYRASFSEMAVPYGDPSGTWNWRCAFDVGEYGVGKSSGTIAAKLDAPENAELFNAVFANDAGRPVIYQDVVGIYERDGGLLWKHWETGGDQQNNESRRGRELVVFTIATVGNYDYSINWIFRQDGAIEVESGLTGIMLPKGNEPITDTDVVLWYTLNVTHIPRPEEWPVMPTTKVGFRLLPGSFFDENPALDVPK
ncbi:MAG TPA: hypothetical protein VE078_12495 [Thermoanaerobaculia bacterium]|nr:hypothetical protein [Thermoanaerobaculia bacterium]